MNSRKIHQSRSVGDDSLKESRSRPLDNEEDLLWEGPEFLDPRPLGKMPRNLWRKMSKDQKTAWVEEKRRYKDALREERRQARAKRRGY